MKAEALQENYLIPKSLYDGKFSKTSQFMLPAISVNITHKLVFKFFENAFLADREHKHNYERPIFMLFSINDYKNLDWKRVYSKLIESPNFITEYDVGIKDNNYLLMLVFQVPEEFEKDYYNFRLGRYSLFSEKYKEKFPEYLDEKKEKKNIHWQIINKDSELRQKIIDTFNVSDNLLDKNDEIWDAPRKEREYFRFKKTE
jgi:hypothetical protein